MKSVNGFIEFFVGKTVYTTVAMTMAICFAVAATGEPKVPIRALCVPMTDHYAEIVAYEKCADKLHHADYQIESFNAGAVTDD